MDNTDYEDDNADIDEFLANYDYDKKELDTVFESAKELEDAITYVYTGEKDEKGNEIYLSCGNKYIMAQNKEGKHYFKNINKQMNSPHKQKTLNADDNAEFTNKRAIEELKESIDGLSRMFLPKELPKALEVFPIKLEDKLTDKAKTIYNNVIKTATLQLPDKSIPFVNFSIRGWLEEGKLPDKYADKLAEIINKLAEKTMINYGMFCQASYLGIEAVLPQEEPSFMNFGSKTFVVLFFFAFSDYTKEELNKFLGADYFVDEGMISDVIW